MDVFTQKWGKNMFDKSLYKSKRLFRDEHFKDGFRVYPPTYNLNRKQKSMIWSFPESENKLETYRPHLLIVQRKICDYKNMPEGEEKRFYSTGCDKICVEYDIRLLAEL